MQHKGYRLFGPGEARAKSMDLDHSLRGRPYEARRNERDARLGGRKGDPRHQGMAPKPKNRWRAATAALLNI
jgi:hypothetical protein